MGWVSGAAVYLIIWWLVIFLVLPWGVQPISSEDVRRGHAESAPRRPHLLLKFAVTTVIAAVLWLGVYWVIVNELISFREG
jgi:predicted secreted protein